MHTAVVEVQRPRYPSTMQGPRGSGALQQSPTRTHLPRASGGAATRGHRGECASQPVISRQCLHGMDQAGASPHTLIPLNARILLAQYAIWSDAYHAYVLMPNVKEGLSNMLAVRDLLSVEPPEREGQVTKAVDTRDGHASEGPTHTPCQLGCRSHLGRIAQPIRQRHFPC